MQLKKSLKQVERAKRVSTQSKKKSIRDKLVMATCALLQTTGSTAFATDEWDVDSAIMFYSEADGRVMAVEPIIAAKKEIADEEFLNVKLVFDSLTGATPNGAYAVGGPLPRTFTNPSGNASYTTAAGENPLDDTFLDTRVAISADWEQPVIDDMTRMILGANISNEFDYMSLGVSATLLRDYNQRNTTFAAAIGLNSDSINPSGGIATPYANMKTAGTGINRDGDSESKSIIDLMVGVTQVINRKTLMQFNLSLSNTSGYMTDPYKIITVVDGSGSIIPVAGDDLPYVYENRPDSRSRQVFFWKTVHHLDEDVINVSYRYHTDDWDINSHTIDFQYRYELNNGAYLQPHIRYYTQSAADFYTHNLTTAQLAVAQAAPASTYASADYRLGEFTTTTIGLKYAQPLGKNQEFNVRAELISQVNEVVDSVFTGDPTTQDVAPDLDATVVQFGYSFKW